MSRLAQPTSTARPISVPTPATDEFSSGFAPIGSEAIWRTTRSPRWRTRPPRAVFDLKTLETEANGYHDDPPQYIQNQEKVLADLLKSVSTACLRS